MMAMDAEVNNRTIKVLATDYLDPDGSVVRSGVAVADAALKALEEHDAVVVSLEGLKGAASSYFNVFLRRIEEGCGLAEIGEHIRLEFDSKIQEMVFERSLASRGPRMPGGQAAAGKTQRLEKGRGLWRRLLRVVGRGGRN
jgi:hypothetical protein